MGMIQRLLARLTRANRPTEPEAAPPPGLTIDKPLQSRCRRCGGRDPEEVRAYCDGGYRCGLVPCVYEARSAHHDRSMTGPFYPWCRTHGWHCPPGMAEKKPKISGCQAPLGGCSYGSCRCHLPLPPAPVS